MTTTRPSGSLYTRIENHIATIEFGHPASNSFPSELLARLSKEFHLLSDNSEIHIIVLKVKEMAHSVLAPHLTNLLT